MATPQQGYTTRSGFADPVSAVEDIAIAAE